MSTDKASGQAIAFGDQVSIREITRRDHVSKAIRVLAISLVAVSLYGQDARTQEDRENLQRQQQAFEELRKSEQQAANGNQSTGGLFAPRAVVEADKGLGPQKPGVIRIALPIPRVQPADERGSQSIQQALQRFLSGPSFQVVAISAGLDSQITAEARQKQCDYILTSSVRQKKSRLGSIIDSGAPMAPIPGGPLAAPVIAHLFHGKAEVIFDFSLEPLNGQAKLTNSFKAQTKSPSDDVLTPLLKQAAENIIASLTKAAVSTH
jgi:hypothetical protein